MLGRLEVRGHLVTEAASVVSRYLVCVIKDKKLGKVIVHRGKSRKVEINLIGSPVPGWWRKRDRPGSPAGLRIPLGQWSPDAASASPNDILAVGFLRELPSGRMKVEEARCLNIAWDGSYLSEVEGG